MKIEQVQQALSFALKKIDYLTNDFADKFPSEQSRNYIYYPINYNSWIESFWSGMLLLTYEISGDEKYYSIVSKQLDIFKNRIEKKLDTDTHDLGFLYSLSCVASYKIKKDEVAKKTALKSAQELIKRYKPKGEFIQAWGALDDPNNYRLIIDCLLNLPLLYWATEVTYDEKYKEIAVKHLRTALNVVIRNNNTTHHTYFFDPITGAPVRGKTAQGYSNDSCWARGQAWSITGIAFSYSYTKDERLIEYYNRVVDCFIDRLPLDYVPYWDMDFTDDDEPKDTSAAAIAICGILEMNKYIKNEMHLKVAERMLGSLIENYTTNDIINANGILKCGMYSRPEGHNPESNIWGDYFYLEALVRISKPSWKSYW